MLAPEEIENLEKTSLLRNVNVGDVDMANCEGDEVEVVSVGKKR